MHRLVQNVVNVHLDFNFKKNLEKKNLQIYPTEEQELRKFCTHCKRGNCDVLKKLKMCMIRELTS